MMKSNLAIKAKPAPRIKCQSMSILKIFRGVRASPVMNAREPVSNMDMTVAMENRIV